MAEVYKFRVQLIELENIIWRDIEITSVSSVAKLGYSILAAFESTASHLFNIKYDGKRYEIMFDEYDFGLEPAIDPIQTKLSSLNLAVGDALTMEYDYGAGWEFRAELVSITEMKRGSGSHYPYVTDGKGKGILEDTSPHQLLEAIKHTDETGEVPTAVEIFSGKEKEWDYREFDLEFCNILFKGNVLNTRYAYELMDEE